MKLARARRARFVFRKDFVSFLELKFALCDVRRKCHYFHLLIVAKFIKFEFIFPLTRDDDDDED